MRLPELSTQEIYHVYNRGVNKRNLFEDESDFDRFYYSLVGLNNKIPRIKNKPLFISVADDIPQNPLVKILAYCLMPNHFHLLLEQCVENGISIFLQKICMSHAKYFNARHARTGALFEPKFQAKQINTNAYFFEISKYIHNNPLDLLTPNNKLNPRDFLSSYRWSSLPTYLKLRQEKFVDLRIMDDFSTPKEYLDFICTDYPRSETTPGVEVLRG